DRVPYSLCAAFPHIVGESEGATSVRSHNLEATIGGATARKAEIVQEHWDSNQLSIGLQRATLCEFCAKEPRTHDVIKYPRLRFGVCLCIGIPNNLAVGQLQFQLSANRNRVAKIKLFASAHISLHQSETGLVCPHSRSGARTAEAGTGPAADFIPTRVGTGRRSGMLWDLRHADWRDERRPRRRYARVVQRGSPRCVRSPLPRLPPALCPAVRS